MNQKIYLDNAASTEPDKAVLKAIKPFLTGFYGNPSSLHRMGLSAREAIETARDQVATVLGARPQEVIFTSGGTESVNLAIQGTAKAYASKYLKIGHIIISAIEHEAVLECVKALSKYGWEFDYLPVDKSGAVDPNQLKKLIKPNTMLVSVMSANNEVGTIQPIREIGSVIASANRERTKKKLVPILFHTDACQAGGILELDVNKLKVDLLTLNGSKIHGPKGSGILYVRSGVNLEPIIYGGGQERGLRSGTENTPAIVGFGAALKVAQAKRLNTIRTLLALQTYLENRLLKISGLQINGPRNIKSNLKKLPGTINFSVKGIEGEALMLYLDAAGFVVATGSACTTGSTEASHVLLAMGVKPELAKATIRLSLSTNVTKSQLNKFVDVLNKTVVMLRNTKHDI